MNNTALLFANPQSAISATELRRQCDNWLLECDFRQVSATTISKYRLVIDKLLWFLAERGFDSCGKTELQHFLVYLRNGHAGPDGRWGNSQLTRPVKSGTSATYFTVLRTFFRYMVAEGVLQECPMDRLPRPVDRPDQIQPFTDAQIGALRAAAKKSQHRRRDEAIVLFLLDTGVRASELCGILVKDVDFQGRRCTVLGKGGKRRAVFFGRDTARTVWTYLKEDTMARDEDSPLFLSDRSLTGSEGLTRSGLLQLVGRLSHAAGIDSIRSSPHVFRHTFAISFLRAGGNVFSLKELLGHSSLTICLRYVSLAQADIEQQHRLCSPVDCLRSGNRASHPAR